MEKEKTWGEKILDPNYLPTRSEVDYVNFLERMTALGTTHADVFEIWTKEYINAFGEYLRGRVNTVLQNRDNVTILDVGAGDGKLVHNICKLFIKEIKDNILKIIAVDEEPNMRAEHVKVEKIDYESALKKYNPEMVISSWMPMDVDFSQTIRDTASVVEYILIGETEGGCCGSGELTWGDNYKRDGFEKVNIENIQIYQRSRSDITNVLNTVSHSRTISFRRKK